LGAAYRMSQVFASSNQCHCKGFQRYARIRRLLLDLVPTKRVLHGHTQPVTKFDKFFLVPQAPNEVGYRPDALMWSRLRRPGKNIREDNRRPILER